MYVCLHAQKKQNRGKKRKGEAEPTTKAKTKVTKTSKIKTRGETTAPASAKVEKGVTATTTNTTSSSSAAAAVSVKGEDKGGVTMKEEANEASGGLVNGDGVSGDSSLVKVEDAPGVKTEAGEGARGAGGGRL